MKFTSAIIPLARVTLGIFIGHYGSHRLEYRTADNILRCNQFEPVYLSLALFLDNIGYFTISLGQM